MEATKTILFVYGTLKRGERNYFRLADQEFVGEVVTAAALSRHRLGRTSGVSSRSRKRPGDSRRAVRGECLALAELDAFEDAPGPFVREQIEVEGYEVVWAYYMNTPVPEGAKSGDRWPL